MMLLRQSGFFDRPTVLIVCYGCLAIYGFRVLVPLAFGSSKRLAENAETIGTSNPRVARIFCIIGMLAVFAGFISVMLLNDEVSDTVRLGVVLSVVATGSVSLWRTLPNPHKENPSATDGLAL